MIDNDCERRIVKTAERGGEHWTICWVEGMCFGGVTDAMCKAAGIEPREGMECVTWPRGFGSVRGVMLDGVMLYYRTEAAEVRRRDVQHLEAQSQRQKELVDSMPSRDARRAALPDNFQRRLAGFEQRNPQFRRDLETYELMVCEDAVKIAAALKTKGAVRAFYDRPHDEQKRLVPGLDDGHSGNSFGAAVQLAMIHVESPEHVEKAHGAMCALTGCDDYGCWATTQAPGR